MLEWSGDSPHRDTYLQELKTRDGFICWLLFVCVGSSCRRGQARRSRSTGQGVRRLLSVSRREVSLASCSNGTKGGKMGVAPN